MEKIREALLRAREDEEFRAAHPVSELPGRQGTAEIRDEKHNDVPVVPDEVASISGSGENAGSLAQQEDGVGSEHLPPLYREGEVGGLSATTTGIPGRADETVEIADVLELDEHGVSEHTAGSRENGMDGTNSAAIPDQSQVLALDPDGGGAADGELERDNLLSGARLLRVAGYICFGAAVLAGVHFFIEPLGPYLDLGLETVNMMVDAGGALWDLISGYVAAGVEAVQALLRDLIG